MPIQARGSACRSPAGHYAPDPTVDFHVVIGDETALPAVATVLDAIDPVGR